MGYHKNTDWILKIWDPIDKRIRVVIFVTFDKTFNNKICEEFLKSFANNLNQKSEIMADNTDSDSNNSKSTPNKI